MNSADNESMTSPKHRHFQDVVPIDRAEPATSLAGSFKGEATDTADLFAVPIGIDLLIPSGAPKCLCSPK